MSRRTEMHPRNVVAILIMLVAVLIGVIVLSTRDVPDMKIGVVQISLAPAHLLNDATAVYAIRIVRVSICRGSATVTQPAAPNYVTDVARSCVSVFGTREYAVDAGCVHADEFDNWNDADFAGLFVEVVPIGTYTHLEFAIEHNVRVAGSVDANATVELHTKACGYDVCPPTCTTPNCDENTCTGNMYTTPAATAVVDMRRFGSTLVVPVPLEIAATATPTIIAARYSLTNTLVAYATSNYYGLETGNASVVVTRPSMVAYNNVHAPTTTWYTGTISGSWALDAATVCASYTADLGADGHPNDGVGFTTGTIIVGVVRTTTVLGVYVGIRAPGAFVYPVTTHTLTSVGDEVNVTQRMYDGTLCPRVIYLNAANASLSSESFAVLIGTNYRQITDVVAFD